MQTTNSRVGPFAEYLRLFFFGGNIQVRGGKVWGRCRLFPEVVHLKRFCAPNDRPEASALATSESPYSMQATRAGLSRLPQNRAAADSGCWWRNVSMRKMRILVSCRPRIRPRVWYRDGRMSSLKLASDRTSESGEDEIDVARLSDTSHNCKRVCYASR